MTVVVELAATGAEVVVVVELDCVVVDVAAGLAAVEAWTSNIEVSPAGLMAAGAIAVVVTVVGGAASTVVDVRLSVIDRPLGLGDGEPTCALVTESALSTKAVAPTSCFEKLPIMMMWNEVRDGLKQEADQPIP